MSKLILQTVVGIGFRQQAALQTANIGTELFRLSKLNANLANITPVIEDDAAEYGKGHEFATEVFAVNTDVSGSLEKYTSSEMMAWLFGMALGKVVETAAGEGGYHYAITPTSTCDPLDLPAWSYLEQVGAACGSATVDRVSVGNVIGDFTLAIGSGPGRQSGKFTANFHGCGKVTSPSTLTMPTDPLVEHLLLAASANVNILGTNYVTSKNMVSLEFSCNNNPRLEQGFYPGSGVDANGFAIRGRMERGNRAFGLNVVGRYDAGSAELTNLMALTTGAASFGLTGAQISTGVHHSLLVTFPKCALKSGVLADDQGVLIVATGIVPMYDTTDGVIKVEVVTSTSGIAQASA
jgi:hypothetical protein